MAKTDIDFQLPEYEEMQPVWEKIDRIVGKKAVKDFILYLNSFDTSQYNKDRNSAYKERAFFAAIAAYTVRGFTGLVFDTEPKIELPDGLAYLETNCDGAGTYLVQQAKQTVKEDIKNGRGALWIDFPRTEGADISVADMENGGIFSTIQVFGASQIFFWTYKQIGSEVVLDEVRVWSTERVKDGYKVIDTEIILQLYLDEETGNYTVAKWMKNDASHESGADDWILMDDPVVPQDGSGQPLKRLPIVFFGSENNTWRIDDAPMQDIVECNVAHLNNSASHEDSVHYSGQPQPWMSGLSTDQVEEMEEGNIYFGSGRLIPVPSGEKLGFEQAGENPLSTQAMMDKVDMAIGLGAMFIQPKQVIKTATQSEGDQRIQHSALSLIASNVTDAYQQALVWVARFMNVDIDAEEEIFKINQDYVQPNAEPSMYREIVASFIQGALPAADYHQFLKKNRLTDDSQDLEEFLAQLEPAGGVEIDDSDDNEPVVDNAEE